MATAQLRNAGQMGNIGQKEIAMETKTVTSLHSFETALKFGQVARQVLKRDIYPLRWNWLDLLTLHFFSKTWDVG